MTLQTRQWNEEAGQFETVTFERDTIPTTMRPSRDTTDTTVRRDGKTSKPFFENTQEFSRENAWLVIASFVLAVLGATYFWLFVVTGKIIALPFFSLSVGVSIGLWMVAQDSQDEIRQFDALNERITKEENRRKEARNGDK